MLSRDVIELTYDGSLDFNTFKGVGKSSTIMATTLDVLYRSGAIGDINLLHLDVEGSEFDVIFGGMELIKALRPTIIFEQHFLLDPTLDAIVEILASLGYVIYMIDEISGANLDCRNFLAVPGRLHAHFLAEFPRMDALLAMPAWSDEAERIKAVLEIEKAVAKLCEHCRHGYEVAKMKALLDQCSPNGRVSA